MFVYVLVLVLLFVVFVGLFDEDDSPYIKWMYCIVLAVLTLLVAFRPLGIDNDSLTYVRYYDFSDDDMAMLAEPTFHVINWLAHLFDSPRVIFLCYALLAIPLKGYAITKLSRFWFLSLAVWMNNYFILQECTQIRTAVASSLFLVAFLYLADRRRWEYVILIILAVFFHYSALLMLPLVVLGPGRLNTPWRWALTIMPLFCYAVHVMGIDPMTMLPIPLFQEKIEIYLMYREMGIDEPVNIFNMLALFRLFSYYFILWKCDEIYKDFKYVYLMLKVVCLSICLFSLFAFIPALGMRSQELLGVTDIVLLPAMAYAVKPQWVVRLFVGLICIVLFLLNVYVNGLLG